MKSPIVSTLCIYFVLCASLLLLSGSLKAQGRQTVYLTDGSFQADKREPLYLKNTPYKKYYIQYGEIFRWWLHLGLNPMMENPCSERQIVSCMESVKVVGLDHKTRKETVWELWRAEFRMYPTKEVTGGFYLPADIGYGDATIVFSILRNNVAVYKLEIPIEIYPGLIRP